MWVNKVQRVKIMTLWYFQVDWSENFLQKKEQRGKMSIILRTAIKACYTYHDCKKINL